MELSGIKTSEIYSDFLHESIEGFLHRKLGIQIRLPVQLQKFVVMGPPAIPNAVVFGVGDVVGNEPPNRVFDGIKEDCVRNIIVRVARNPARTGSRGNLLGPLMPAPQPCRLSILRGALMGKYELARVSEIKNRKIALDIIR